MIPVILSGGSGTRLWPISRTKFPKQFCNIFEESLQQLTLKRLSHVGNPWIVTNFTLRDLTLNLLKNLKFPEDQVIFEPESRNTAPAVALLTHYFTQIGKGNEVVGIFPADHLIQNEAKFIEILKYAESQVQQDKIATLGVSPTYPATGFGYIETQKKSDDNFNGFSSTPVENFYEKPTLSKANQFMKAGNFYWNAGIFVFKVSTMVQAFSEMAPEMWKSVTKINKDFSNLNEIYANLESISIDYAIMEKLGPQKLVCIPCDVGWNDVGSWDAVAEILAESKPYPKSHQYMAKDNFVIPYQQRTYSFLGVDDLIVVDTPDALLIAKKGTTQRVKDVVDKFRTTDPHLISTHTFENRPWGKFEILRDNPKFKSKVMEVLPGQQLSYQSHKSREEHWIVVSGEGEVVLNEKTIPVSAGTYVKIPQGAKHRMRNKGDQKLEFVEVQLGTYFGEDDITRYEDDYSRA